VPDLDTALVRLRHARVGLNIDLNDGFAANGALDLTYATITNRPHR
jgi:hypothetical protein